MCDLRRDLVKKRLGRNKVLFSSQQDWIANSQTTNTGFPTLLAPEKQMFGLLPASGFIENQIDSDFSLLPYLTHFVVCFFAGRFYFRFVRSWIIDLAMDEIKSKGADITVSFFKWFLWKMLTIF